MILIVQQQDNADQQCHLFDKRVRINGRSIKMIIDGGSCYNWASEKLCSKLHLKYKCHPRPYKFQWLSDISASTVEHIVEVPFKIDVHDRLSPSLGTPVAI